MDRSTHLEYRVRQSLDHYGLVQGYIRRLCAVGIVNCLLAKVKAYKELIKKGHEFR